MGTVELAVNRGGLGSSGPSRQAAWNTEQYSGSTWPAGRLPGSGEGPPGRHGRFDHANHLSRSQADLRPAAVLVTELATGAFVVQDYSTGRAAYVGRSDSQALREALDAAFGEVGLAMTVQPIVRPRI